MIDEAKFDAWVAHLRKGLLAHLNRSLRARRWLIIHEIKLKFGHLPDRQDLSVMRPP
jgi:hypothetical protein